MTGTVAIIRRRSTLLSGASNAAIVAVRQRPGLRPARATNAVLPPLTITGTPPASAIAGAFYSFTPGVSGGTPPYSFGLTGDLPPGLTFDPATGTISGTAL